MNGLPNGASLDIQSLQKRYRGGELRPTALVEALYERIEACAVTNIWIHLLPKVTVLAQAARLEVVADPTALPLYGIPYAVKDNIDVAGEPTTAGCPAFSYTPAQSATVVDRLTEAGALLIGKTNLDQFATGLVGTRSPYGVCPNPFNLDYIAGGSSSGSAVAVSSGLVSFALGTDTAGSGRVPAGFNNIVGLKPSKGLISTKGVVPACRSLDCVSIFAQTCPDALTVLEVAQGFDPDDPFSRIGPRVESPPIPPKGGEKISVPPSGGLGGQTCSETFCFGIPQASQLAFFGNGEYERLFAEAVNALSGLDGQAVEIDFAPFIETANLLYEGPWVAERYAAIKGFVTEQPEALLPITREIIEGGRRYSAVDVYESYYRLRAYHQQTAPLWQEIDFLVVPTSGTIYTIAEVEAEPLTLNSNLGYYTNFVNLLDLCAWAVPNGFQKNGLPMGVTFIAPAFQEARLAAMAAAFHRLRTGNQ